MSAEEIVDLGFDGLRKQRTRSLAQNIRELIVECSWLNQFRDGIVRHGISLLQWRSGGSSTPTICRLTDSCRHQLLAIAHSRIPYQEKESLYHSQCSPPRHHPLRRRLASRTIRVEPASRRA